MNYYFYYFFWNNCKILYGIILWLLFLGRYNSAGNDKPSQAQEAPGSSSSYDVIFRIADYLLSHSFLNVYTVVK